MTQEQQLHQATSGAGYFFKGFELIRKKGIRRFVFIPLTINVLLFSIAFYFMFLQLEHYMVAIMQWLPSWLDWLEVVIWPLAVITILVFFSFIFSTAANWLAAPFNGLLSEKIESILSGKPAPQGNMLDIVKDVPRTLGREWKKLAYYLPRAIGFFIIMWILPVFGQVIWFLFISWMMAVQYKDYPFDNHKVPFHEMKNALKQRQGLSYSFGITVAFFAMVPIVNLIVMPVAICGATALWCDHYKQDYARY
ncbi:sulfate transporter CysZ [Litorilituus sediminis]|uniref:Sulfate transporter CysZ n=1 Tax=Litorilituus sediminis TaxID=718192 RepID=A0A4P6P0B1_9GAMM|nr:sulfate transporter CysZ [Litorilituus sediminis]QBG34263.1 sulfate transporter CysZ [Litorilituus sediminis]